MKNKFFSRFFEKKRWQKFVGIKNSTTFALAFGNHRGNAMIEQ